MNNEVLGVALAGLVTAIQTALLMYAAYYWPAGRNEHDDERGTHRHNRHDKRDDDEV